MPLGFLWRAVQLKWLSRRTDSIRPTACLRDMLGGCFDPLSGASACANPNSFIMSDEDTRDIDRSTVVKVIEQSRVDRGISVAELARRIGVDRKRLWYILNSQREMRVDEFLKLCVFFDLGPGRFVTREQVRSIRDKS